jgi:ring-1,2-phenylacetyl-CoA epoxidase subunit PaaE
VFDIPEDLKQQFQYTQGQSLTMRAIVNGEELRRTYSLCSSPADNEWKVAVKKVESGLFSVYANEQLKKGDILEVMEPVGKFYTQLDPANKKNYLAIAAGSGITPVLSIIKTTLITEPAKQFYFSLW